MVVHVTSYSYTRSGVVTKVLAFLMVLSKPPSKQDFLMVK